MFEEYHVPTAYISKSQHDNLKLLLAGAKDYAAREAAGEVLPTKFDMRKFSSVGFWFDLTVTNCGTSGCLAGHGPLFGVPKASNEDWFDYVRRVFVYFTLDASINDTRTVVGFLFSPVWADRDCGTMAHAVLRLEHVLANCVEIVEAWS